MTCRFVAPLLLYVQEPPFEAYQYDQYAVAGGVLMQCSFEGPGLLLIRQTKPGPSCCVGAVVNPALCSAMSPLVEEPAPE
jgi:hypothetical protein